MKRIALIAVLAGTSASAQPVMPPVPTAAMQPGYGVVESVIPVRVASREASAAAGGSSAMARAVYRVTVRMADGSLQVRDLDRPEFKPGDEVLLTNSGDVVSDADSRNAGDADRGSIAPGEKGGMPQKDKGAAAGRSASPVQRCYQLEGTLREQCLADEALNKKKASPSAPGAGSRPRH